MTFFLNFEALFFFNTGHDNQINLWKVKFSLTSKKISKLLLTPKNMHACFLPYFAKMCLISRKNCAIRFSHNFSHFSVNLNSNWCCDLFIIIAIIHSKHAISQIQFSPPPLSISSRTPPTLILPISSRTCMNFSRVVCNAFMLRLLVFPTDDVRVVLHWHRTDYTLQKITVAPHIIAQWSES